MKYCSVLILFFWIMLACDDSRNQDDVDPVSSDNKDDQNSNNSSGNTSNGTLICDFVKYSDSLYYTFGEKRDQKIEPLKRGDGEYGSIPEGLEINKSNGEINITKSESGLTYKVYFLPKGSKDTCFFSLKISGIDYLSDIYILSKNQNIAIPIFNNDSLIPIPGIQSGKTEFDDGPDDDDNDGFDDEPFENEQVIPQGLAISKIDGKIALDQTVSNGVFGKVPKNGEKKKFRIYYRIDDDSKLSLNKIDIEIHYFDTDKDIPQELKDQVEDNKWSIDRSIYQNKQARIFRIPKKPRPPQIVIVGRAAQ